MKTLTLKYEYSSSKSEVWGTTTYNGDLIVEWANDLDELQQKMRAVLLKIYGLEKLEFTLKAITGIL